jgi:hypothetical protein
MTQVRLVKVWEDIVARTSARVLAQLQAVNPLITAVHYKYGHYTDIKQELSAGMKNPFKNTEKYPLIVLFEDFRVDKRTPGMQGIANMIVMILFTSKAEFTRQQREDLVFIPIIQPIYEALLVEMKISGAFKYYGSQPPHTETDRPHWGDPSLYKNNGYLLGDCLDGKELGFSQLQTFFDICIPASNIGAAQTIET